MEKKDLHKQDEHIYLTCLKDSNVEQDSTVTIAGKECVAALNSDLSSDAEIHVNDGRKDPLYINLDTGDSKEHDYIECINVLTEDSTDGHNIKEHEYITILKHDIYSKVDVKKNKNVSTFPAKTIPKRGEAKNITNKETEMDISSVTIETKADDRPIILNIEKFAKNAIKMKKIKPGKLCCKRKFLIIGGVIMLLLIISGFTIFGLCYITDDQEKSKENNFTTNFRESSTSSNNGLYTNGYTSSMTSNSTAHMIEISHSSQSEFSKTIYNNTNGQTKTFNKEARDISNIQLREMKEHNITSTSQSRTLINNKLLYTSAYKLLLAYKTKSITHSIKNVHSSQSKLSISDYYNAHRSPTKAATQIKAIQSLLKDVKGDSINPTTNNYFIKEMLYFNKYHMKYHSAHCERVHIMGNRLLCLSFKRYKPFSRHIVLFTTSFKHLRYVLLNAINIYCILKVDSNEFILSLNGGMVQMKGDAIEFLDKSEVYDLYQSNGKVYGLIPMQRQVLIFRRINTQWKKIREVLLKGVKSIILNNRLFVRNDKLFIDSKKSVLIFNITGHIIKHYNYYNSHFHPILIGVGSLAEVLSLDDHMLRVRAVTGKWSEVLKCNTQMPMDAVIVNKTIWIANKGDSKRNSFLSIYTYY